MSDYIRVSYRGFTGDLLSLEKARPIGIGAMTETPKGYVMRIWNEENQEILDFHVENPEEIQFLSAGVVK